MTLVYLDSSAFVKTILHEPESMRLRAWLRDRPYRWSCALLRVEALRAIRPHGADRTAEAQREIEDMSLVRLTNAILDAAAELQPTVRSLDAIHLAAARALGDELGALVTYDARMAAAAEELGLPVVAP